MGGGRHNNAKKMIMVPVNNGLGLRNVKSTAAARNISKASKKHMSGFFVFGDGEGRIVGSESHLEFNVALCLSAHSDTCDLHEQVPFGWQDADGKQRTHYFDFVVTKADGKRIAYSVKPLALFRGTFAETIPQIAEQAKNSGHYADVGLFTEEDLDPAMLFNANGSSAGVPVETVLATKTANSLFVVDEIDKTGAVMEAKGGGTSVMVSLPCFSLIAVWRER